MLLHEARVFLPPPGSLDHVARQTVPTRKWVCESSRNLPVMRRGGGRKPERL
jgi:hypothetical protein